MTVLADVQLPNHPCHVPSQRTHGLHAFLVECGLARRLPIHHVPILRGDDGHVENGEILVQSVESSRCAATTTHHNRGGRLELQLLAQRVEHAVEECTERAVGAAIIDGGTNDESVDAVADRADDLLVDFIAERAASLATTHATGNATLHGLRSDTDDFRLHTFLLQGLRHLAQRQERIALPARTTID